MEMWTHWLPTEHSYNAAATYAIKTTLQKLNAPQEVIDEYEFAAKLGFHEFAMRSPVRKDARDPLLLARMGRVWYRIALWGESLLPLDQIGALVLESLEIRQSTARRWFWLRLGGGLGALAIALWSLHAIFMNTRTDAGLGFVVAWMLFCFTWVATLVHSADNAQHSFLDRYRR